LLDLTTNPLVALYFACEKYGDVCYVEVDGKEEKIPQEANGVIFFNKRYPESTNKIDIKVKFITNSKSISYKTEKRRISSDSHFLVAKYCNYISLLSKRIFSISILLKLQTASNTLLPTIFASIAYLTTTKITLL